MLRAALLAAVLFLSLGLTWAAYDPWRAGQEVAQLGARAADPLRAEESILRRGRGALAALHRGLDSADPVVRLRCARLLALLGEEEQERVLLAALSAEPDAPEASLAGHLLLTLWDRRGGPRPEVLPAAWSAHVLRGALDPGLENRLNVLLERHPNWVGGYVLRAEYFLSMSEGSPVPLDPGDPAFEFPAPGGVLGRAATARLAQNNACEALQPGRAPNHFEALEILGRAHLLQGHAAAAMVCFERALAIHPGLRPRLAGVLDEARKAAAAQRERELEERRRELPVV